MRDWGRAVHAGRERFYSGWNPALAAASGSTEKPLLYYWPCEPGGFSIG